MKARKMEELRNEIRQINEILLTAQSSFRITKYLLLPDLPSATEFINQSVYFQYSLRMNWRLTVIELSKLLATNKDRDRYNLHHFTKKLKKDGQFGDAKKAADKFYALELHDPSKWEKDITKWETRLLSEKLVIDNLMFGL